MFDWIPIFQYTPIYYYLLLLVVLLSFVHSQTVAIDSSFNLQHIRKTGVFLLFFVVLYMGLRPVHGVFTDMVTYANIFERYQNGYPITSSKDPLFHLFMQNASKIIGLNSFFFLCTLLYVIPLYLICKKWFKEYWFYGFLMIVTAFAFWAAGTNGIRNAIAGSFFLLGISRDKRIFQIIWLFIAVNFHFSILLPTIAFIIVHFYNKPKYYLFFWLFCIPLSLIGGGFWESLFANLGFEDERLSYLTEGNVNNDNFAYTGFRWDFLIYSATAVFAGWYYVIKIKFEDPIYFKLLNIYLFANAFWILVIRSNFSNRFAYLSWFILALVIIYPFLKKKIVKNQHKTIGLIILAHFLFTFIMNVIL
ncbi:EpsG family protein [Croceibacter atlanticus]|uniref:EpsG family protein n=1 Tax=Croceibacter atlanticus TaxID=313588 RepID=UPI0030D9675B|tara:strand:- start:85943 stop:87028 length:1086 start_codon:yes stop_codon:yes gene_type:complete